MTQRKCGTCRYFEEGGIAASGWCRHPERQELQHMVLVRKTELACRDGWDHDLWEPKDGSDGSNGTGPRGGGNAARPRSMGPSTDDSSRNSSDASRIREGFPERLEGGATALGVREAENPARRDDQEAVFNTDWSPFDTPSLPFNRTRDREPVDEIRNETFSTRGLRIDTEWREQVREPAEPQPDEPSDPVEPTRNGTRSAERHDLNPFNRTGDDFTGRFGAPSQGFPQDGREISSEREPGSYEPEPVEQSGLTEPFEFTELETEMTEPVHEPTDEAIEATDADDQQVESDTAPSDVGDDYEHGALNVPLSLQQEQCCRTCRDFRPAEGGRSGWCNNPFAFEQRQKVDPDDLACHGTYGNWWSPADDWWIERADISHHSTPTPLVDELIRDGQEQHDERPRSTAKRKSS